MSKIVRDPVTITKEFLICDCGGEMLPTGVSLLTKPPKNPHKCKDCGHIDNVLGETFPRIQFS